MNELRELAGAVGLLKSTLAATVDEYAANPTPEARAKLDQHVQAIVKAFVDAAGSVFNGTWALDNRWPIQKAGNRMAREFMSAADTRGAWEPLKREAAHG